MNPVLTSNYVTIMLTFQTLNHGEVVCAVAIGGHNNYNRHVYTGGKVSC